MISVSSARRRTVLAALRRGTVPEIVVDVLDRVEQFDDFDPRRHYALTISDRELTDVERQAAHTPDDIDVDV